MMMKQEQNARQNKRRVGCRLALVLLLLGWGTVAGAQPYWSPPVNISNSGADGELFSGRAQLARDMDGNLHCVYQDIDGAGYEELFYAHNLGGGWVQYETHVSGGDPEGADQGLVCTPDNVLYLFYKRDGDMYAATKSPSATSFGGAVRLDSDGNHYFESADVSAGGTICMTAFVMWDGGTDSAVRAYRKPFGGSWSTTNLKSKSSAWTNGSDVVAWGEKFAGGYVHDRKPYVRICDTSGNWSSAVQVGKSAFGGFGLADNPPAGQICALFGYDDGEESYFDAYCKVSADGVNWGSEMVIANANGIEGNPTGTYDSAGNLYAFYVNAADYVHKSQVSYRVRDTAGVWSDRVDLWPAGHRTGWDTRAVNYWPEGIALVYTETNEGFEDVLFTLGYNNPPETPFVTNTPTASKTYTITRTPTVTLTRTITNTPRWGNATATPTFTHTPTPTRTHTATPLQAENHLVIW